MIWTVNRRIAAGMGVVLSLFLVLSVVALGALRAGRGAFLAASELRETRLVPALELDSDFREATVQLQRFLLSPDPNYAALRDSAVLQSRARLTELRDASSTVEGRARWAEALDLLTRWDAASRRVIEVARTGARDEAIARWQQEVLDLRYELRGAIDAELEHVAAVSDSAVAAADRTARRMEVGLLIAAILTLTLAIVGGWILNRAVGAPLRETTSVLASSAAEILAATSQQASSARETSAAVVQTSTTVDEVAQTAEQASSRARAVSESAQRAAEISQRGHRAVEESVSAMGEVREQVESIADSILGLAEQAQAIGEIIATVNEIAEQTNLLALNAAVEAARAGEHGRGFAVVAGEVRNLADESKRATVQVRQILGEIQRSMSTAVMTTERGTQKVVSGSAQVEEAGGTIRALTEAVTEAAHAAAQIVASAGQQAVGMTQIRQAMGDIQEATHQTLTSTRQSEQAAQDLNELGMRLLALVGRDSATASRTRSRV